MRVVGVLALQGDFEAHGAALARLGLEARPVRTAEEVRACAHLVAGVWPETLLVLQPVTPARRIAAAPTVAQLLRLQSAARDILPNVRVMAQMHKMLGAL